VGKGFFVETFPMGSQTDPEPVCPKSKTIMVPALTFKIAELKRFLELAGLSIGDSTTPVLKLGMREKYFNG